MCWQRNDVAAMYGKKEVVLMYLAIHLGLK